MNFAKYETGKFFISHSHFLILHTEKEYSMHHGGIPVGLNEILGFQVGVGAETIATWQRAANTHRMKIIPNSTPMFFVCREHIPAIDFRYKGIETWRVLINDKIGFIIVKKWMNVEPHILMSTAC